MKKRSRPAIILAVLLLLSGVASSEPSIAEALGLIQPDGSQDWSFLLVTPGCNVPVMGFLVLNGTENDSLEATA